MTATSTRIVRDLLRSATRKPAGTQNFQHIAFVASESDEARRAQDRLEQRYGATVHEQIACGFDAPRNLNRPEVLQM
jgi:hypothetical protein